MKSISHAIWILGALLVIATLDALPDPPAVNPSIAQCKVLQLHHYSRDAVTPRCDSLGTSYPIAVSLVVADACEPNHRSYRMVLTRRATDSSPPAQTGGKLSFQSV